MTTTDLTIPNPTAALGRIEDVRALAGLEIACMMVGRQIPGELDDEQRLAQGRAVIEETATYIAGLKDSKGVLGCCRISLVETLMNLASINLKLTPSLGWAYLIPYSRVLSLMIGYKGLAELIMRTGRIASIQTAVVYKGEEERFEYELGTNGYMSHKPRHDIQRNWDTTIAAWMEVKLVGGGSMIEVMDRADLEKVRKASGMPDGPAWKYWPGQMTRKAPMRRGASYLPKGTGMAAMNLARALEIENSEYNLEKYHKMKKVESRKLDDEAAAAIGGTDPDAAPSPDGQSPPPDLMTGKRALVDKVSAARDGCGSTMTDIQFCEDVIYDTLKKNTIDDLEELAKVNAAVDSGKYDWNNAEKIPQGD